MIKIPKNINTFILILLVITIIFPFLPVLITGKVIYWGTSTTQFLPWLNFAFTSISQGDFPLWNPYNGMGAPFLANYQTALFYFPNWILWIFYKFSGINGLATGTTLSILFHLLFASLGMYKLLKFLKRSSIAAYFGSVIWVFSGYAISRVSFFTMIWSFSWISWIIYALLLLNSSQNDRIRRICFFSFLLSMQFLSGHAQTAYYTLIILVFVVAIQSHKNFNEFFKKFGLFMLAFIFSVLLSAVQLIPTAEYLLYSQRSREVGFEYAVNFSFWPLRILSTIFGNFWGNPGLTRFFGGGVYWEDNLYIGIFPLILIFLLLIFYFRKRMFPEEQSKERKFIFALLLLGLLAFLFSLGKNFFLFPFFYRYIPTFNMFQAPSRFLLITSLSLAITSAYAFDHWEDYSFNPRKIGIIIIVGIAFVISDLVSMNLIAGIPVEIHQSILVSAGLILIFGIFTILKDNHSIQNKPWLIILFALISSVNIILINFPIGNFLQNQYLNSISSTNRILEDNTIYINDESEEFIKFNRYFRFDRFQLLDNLESEMAFLLPNTNLFDPQYKMINNFDPFQPAHYANFMDWVNSLENGQRKTILRMIGTSLIADIDVKTESGYDFQPINGNEIVQWYDCSVVLPTDDSLDWILYNESSNSDKRCLLLENGEPLQNTVPDAVLIPERVNFKQIKSGEISISYSLNQDGWLVIRQTWYPGWQAKLDNKTVVNVEKVDYLFQGLFVPAGTHNIILKYKPVTFTIGFYISLINWIILILLSLKHFDFQKRIFR